MMQADLQRPTKLAALVAPALSEPILAVSSPFGQMKVMLSLVLAVAVASSEKKQLPSHKLAPPVLRAPEAHGASDPYSKRVNVGQRAFTMAERLKRKVDTWNSTAVIMREKCSLCAKTAHSRCSFSCSRKGRRLEGLDLRAH
jgi:hypothetical protein